MKQFVKMPSYWIRDQEIRQLRNFRWKDEARAGNIAALMLYIVLVQHMNVEADRKFDQPGFVAMSYSEFNAITGLSRAMISKGLSVLEQMELINIDRSQKTSVYQVINSNRHKGWAQLPYKHLYQGGNVIKAFHDFHLRKRAELDALKIYLLLIAFRDNDLNHASISYEKITFYTGIPANYIRTAISFLVANVMIQVDQRKTDDLDNFKTTNYYRIVGIPGKHFGNMDLDVLDD